MKVRADGDAADGVERNVRLIADHTRHVLKAHEYRHSKGALYGRWTTWAGLCGRWRRRGLVKLERVVSGRYDRPLVWKGEGRRDAKFHQFFTSVVFTSLIVALVSPVRTSTARK